MNLENNIKRWGLLRRVKKELLLDKYLQTVKKPDEEKKRELIKHWLKQNQINSQEQLDQWMSKNELKANEWEDLAIRSWQWSEHCLKVYAGEINSHYLKRKSNLDKVTYYLLRTESKDLVEELYLRIKENENSFANLSSEYSEGPEKKSQGLIGPVPIGKTHPALAKLLMSSTRGQLWSPRKLDKWWIVIKMVELECTQLDEKIKRMMACEIGEINIEKEIDSTQIIGNN